MKQRTIDNMHPAARNKARKLWESMQYMPDGSGFEVARDAYHAMLKDNRNFVSNTEPYRAA